LAPERLNLTTAQMIFAFAQRILAFFTAMVSSRLCFLFSFRVRRRLTGVAADFSTPPSA